RALNNRYLKLSVRAPEPYNLLEPEFEKIIRKTIRRGTIQLSLHSERQSALQDFCINAVALRSYLAQLRGLADQLGSSKVETERVLGQVLALPGVVPEPGVTSFDAQEEWPILEKILEEAMERLQAMRQEEGRAMAQEFLQYRDHIAGELQHIRERAP